MECKKKKGNIQIFATHFTTSNHIFVTTEQCIAEFDSGSHCVLYYFVENPIESIAMSVLRKASLLTLIKQVSNKNRNIRTQIIATTDNILEE